MVRRDRPRSFTFTIHNQGKYDPQKKQDLLDYLNTKYPPQSYIIVQELYPNADKTALDPSKVGDSHLQGNLYYKNQIDFHKLLEFLQAKYKPVYTDAGCIGRVELDGIKKVAGKSLAAMDNYFKGTRKMGGDPEPLENMDFKKDMIGNALFEKEFKNLMGLVISKEIARRNLKTIQQQELEFFNKMI